MTPQVLIADDNDFVRNTLARLVSRYGCIGVEAATVADACALLDAGELGVLIVDMRLPSTSGVDVLAHARRLCSAAPILAITGDDSGIYEAAIAHFEAELLVKPFERADVGAFLTRALATPSLDTLGVSDAERALLVGARRGWKRPHIACEASVAESALDAIERALLTRTGARSIAGLWRRVG